MATSQKSSRYIKLRFASILLAILFTVPFGSMNANAIRIHTPLDVALIVDNSGSMGSTLGSQTKITAAKASANAFIDKMDPALDQVSIVPFTGSASASQLTNNFANAKASVNGMGASGGTNYYNALVAAQTELASTRKHDGSMPVIVFMSDGAPGDSETTITDKTDALKALGIQIFTIYLGTGTSDILSKMASNSEGTTDHYFNVDDAANLAQLYVTIATKLQSPNVIYIGKYGSNSSSNLTLNASTLDPNKTVILKVIGTVTIAGNQEYNPNNKGAKYKDASQLPQLVIIADKIVINRDVTKVDAWLIARGNGTIATCDDVSTSTKDTCTKQLVVNGPVMAGHLELRRTYGSGLDAASESNIPAEIFNLRADSYLWAIAHSISYGRSQTVSTTELPTRF